MIRYVANKKYKDREVKKLLSISRFHNKFTNNGPVKKLLEQEINDRLGLKNKCVICVSSGTAALHTLLNYLSIDDFYSFPFTFPSVIVNNKVRIDANKHANMIITNLFGTNCVDDAAGITIYDNCSSPFNLCQYGNYSFGSLHHTKYWGVGEGGFVVAPKDEYYAIQQLANFGLDRNGGYKINSFNYKMSDFAAAYILSHIKNYDMKKHIEVQNKLVDVVGDKIYNYSDGIVLGCLPLVFDRPVDKDDFPGIEAQKMYRPLVKNEYFEDIYSRLIVFPLNCELTDDDVEFMKNMVQKC